MRLRYFRSFPSSSSQILVAQRQRNRHVRPCYRGLDRSPPTLFLPGGDTRLSTGGPGKVDLFLLTDSGPNFPSLVRY